MKFFKGTAAEVAASTKTGTAGDLVTESDTGNISVADGSTLLGALKRLVRFDEVPILSGGKVPETNIPDRLSDSGLSASYGAVLVLTPAMTASDMTTEVAAMVAEVGKVTIRPTAGADTLRIDGVLELEGTQALHLETGVTIERPVTSGEDGPVVWVRGQGAALTGVSRQACEIRSLVQTPLGVVCVGYLGETDTTARQANNNTVRGLALRGHAQGGNTTGTPTRSLLLCNMQVSDLASYFHTVMDLELADANEGLGLLGWANANHFGNLLLSHVGDGAVLDGAGIALRETSGMAPVDNIFSGVFHHASADAVTLLLDGAGINYNDLTGLNSEQGGASALWFKTTSDSQTGNQIRGSANVGGGWSMISSAWLEQNGASTQGRDYTTQTTTEKLTARVLDFSGDPLAGTALPGNPAGWVPIKVFGLDYMMPIWPMP